MKWTAQGSTYFSSEMYWNKMALLSLKGLKTATAAGLLYLAGAANLVVASITLGVTVAAQLGFSRQLGDAIKYSICTV